MSDQLVILTLDPLKRGAGDVHRIAAVPKGTVILATNLASLEPAIALLVPDGATVEPEAWVTISVEEAS